jgi:23S rRNA pseudouridine2605 synthase
MPRPQEPERLQKFLSRLGVASRREAEQWIRAGRLSINGRPAVLGERVDAGDQLRLDGRRIRQSGAQRELPVLLCHRSPGLPLLSTRAMPDSFAARLPRRTGPRFMSISPLPQVDGGLELLTADGALAVRLQRAVRTQPVVYSLRVRGELGAQQRLSIMGGELDRGTVLRIIRIEEAGGAGSNRWYQLETIGASGNDLRQLLERQAVAVSRLMRVRLGGLQLERAMARGRWRELLPAEIDSLLKPATAMSSAADNPDSAP